MTLPTVTSHNENVEEDRKPSACPIANEMLTNASGERWRCIRGVVSPTFTSSKSRSLYPILQEQSRLLKAAVSARVAVQGECCIQSKDLCDQYMISAIASCAFGITIASDSVAAQQFPMMAARLLRLTWTRAIKVVTLLVTPWLVDALTWFGVDFTSTEFAFFKRVVQYTIQTRARTGAWRGDFLDLMGDTKKLSSDSITAQSVLFLLAGYANTSSGLSLALHLLAQHPHQQAALRREIASAMRSHSSLDSNTSAQTSPQNSSSSSSSSSGFWPMPDEVLTYDAVQSLPLLMAVVEETLRLYPGGPVIERVCTQEYTISGTQVTLKVGQPLLVPVWSIHRDPVNFPNPEQFEPARFLPPNRENIAPFTFIPFGIGPRSCVGQRFAEMSIKDGLVMLLTQFVVSPCGEHSQHPPPLHPRVLTLNTGNSLPLTFTAIANLTNILEKEMEDFPPTQHEKTETISNLMTIIRTDQLIRDI